MFNHHRGLWGYTGRAADGEPLTVQSTGMGGPSAAIVVEELIRLGARTLIRTGTCGALTGDHRLGDVLAVSEAIPADGASRALGADGRVPADPALTAALASAGADHTVTAVSTDLFYDSPDRLDRWRAAGAAAVEMEAAAVLAVAAGHGVPAACLLMVTDELAGEGRVRMEHEEIEERSSRLGEIALAALRADGNGEH
jgi:uridine phosphorylase